MIKRGAGCHTMTTRSEIETLFTEHNPTDYGYAKHAEDEFGYMNRHADAPVRAARELLETWYQHYPAAHRLDLVRRFRRSNHKQHDGAFWELFLHELFWRMGYGVQVHPQLAAISTRPDFLLTKDAVPVALVEARLAGLDADQVTSAERLKKELHDALDNIDSPNFFLHVKQIKTAPNRPTFKHLVKSIEKWLATLNPDLPVEAFVDHRNSSTHLEWEHEGWFLSLGVIPKSPEHRGRGARRSVGIISGDTQWLDTKGQLRQALTEKACRYGKSDLPFILAINYLGTHCDKEDWTDALYGSQATNVWYDDCGVHHQQPFRKNDGFWIQNGRPQHTNVSAVLAASNINTWSMGAHVVQVYQHIAPDHPIDLDGNLPCWFVPSGMDELVSRPGKPSAEILGIPRGWPGEWS
jgi:hypothetical protein